MARYLSKLLILAALIEPLFAVMASHAQTPFTITQEQPFTITLTPTRDLKLAGTTTITHVSDFGINVDIKVTGLKPNDERSVHIHSPGTVAAACDTDGPVVYPLTNVKADASGTGISSTRVTFDRNKGFPTARWYVNVQEGAGGATGAGVICGLTQPPSAPDMTKFGFPTLVAAVNFTPGQATSVSAGGHKVELPADFLDEPAKFELLTGDNAIFQPLAGGRTVVTTFGFRVIDTTTNQLVGNFPVGVFTMPVQWSFTGPAITPQSTVLNTSADSPPKVFPNPQTATVKGQTISVPFAGAAVGWLVANPAGALAAGAAPATLPRTGSGGGRPGSLLVAVLALAAVAPAGAGLALSRRH